MRTLKNIILMNLRYRKQIFELAIDNQKKTYKGSDLGFVWAFIKPAVYISVFYVAISIGFKSSKAIEGLICPYFIWLAVGLIAWFYMQGMILAGASSINKFKFIVIKTNFPAIVLPTVVSLSNLMIHLVLVVGMLILSMFFGVMPSIYWLELIFYIGCSFVFATLWSIVTGLLSAVSRDFYNLLQSISMAVFWLSAILFDVNKLSAKAQTVFMFNPVTYIVEGYRNAVCRHVWFFEEPMKLLCYLAVMALMAVLAILCHKKITKVLPEIL